MEHIQQDDERAKASLDQRDLEDVDEVRALPINQLEGKGMNNASLGEDEVKTVTKSNASPTITSLFTGKVARSNVHPMEISLPNLMVETLG